jgi:hypothetical protein
VTLNVHNAHEAFCYEDVVPVVLRNRLALFYRGFMLTFLAGVLLITWVAFRDRDTIEGVGWLTAVLVPFWIAGLWGCWWAFRQETITVTVSSPGRLVLITSTLFQSTRLEVTSAMVSRIDVVEGKDSDGDPYFRGVLSVAGAGHVTVAEGHQRRIVEKKIERLQSALQA